MLVACDIIYDVIQRWRTVWDDCTLTPDLVLGVIHALKCNRASKVITILQKSASIAPFKKLAHAPEYSITNSNTFNYIQTAFAFCHCRPVVTWFAFFRKPIVLRCQLNILYNDGSSTIDLVSLCSDFEVILALCNQLIRKNSCLTILPVIHKIFGSPNFVTYVPYANTCMTFHC